MTSVSASNASKEEFFSASEDSWDRISDTSSNMTAKSAKATTPMKAREDPVDRPSESRGTNYGLQPGTYFVENDQNRDMVLDLSGYDFISVLAYTKHGGDNQKWEFERLGPGYSIRSVLKGTYITLQTGAIEGGSLIASPFPVSWELEADEYESGLWRIRWPRSNFVFDSPNGKRNTVTLSGTYPFKPTRLWRLVEVELAQPKVDDTIEFTTAYSPKKLEVKPAVVTTADTIVDVEGLKLGGNGEMSITTTTTTVTTSVTTVKRLGIPSS